MNNDAPPLWTQQLDRLLAHHPLTRDLFRGVYPCDQLPHPTPLDTHGRFRPWLCVVNTHPASQPGEHWLLLGVDDPAQLHIFDSFGKDLKIYQNPWLNRFRRAFTRVHQNSTQYQGVSNACGYYCIYAAARRGLTGTYNFQTYPDFKPNKFKQNDNRVTHIVSTHLDPLNVISDIVLTHGQTCIAPKNI